MQIDSSARIKVNKRTQELIQAEPHQAPNYQRERQTYAIKQSQNEHMASRDGNSFPKKSGNSITQT